MSRVVVGMSGGVDSAVSAYLLKLAGYEVVGVTLRSWLSSDGKESRCCEIDDARRVAWKLGMPYYVVNCMAEFRNLITKPFIEEYMRGVTPNPCVLCNPLIKWEKMIEAARVMGADHIATGHYASVVRKENGRYTVRKALSEAKDQTYMLYRLSQEQLAATIMPLGNLSKAQVREIAGKAGLPVASKKDSQEICFVTQGDYADYIEENAEQEIPVEGDFIGEEGAVVGRHKGIIHYTVGQRKGLGLALGYPVYVKEIRALENAVVVGKEASLYSKELFCKNLKFMSIPGLSPGEEMDCAVKVRYHHPGQKARICMREDGRVKIVFDESVRAASPGQSAVFYDAEDCVIGGGIIEGGYVALQGNCVDGGGHGDEIA